jgi:hypothetical protein
VRRRLNGRTGQFACAASVGRSEAIALALAREGRFEEAIGVIDDRNYIMNIMLLNEET